MSKTLLLYTAGPYGNKTAINGVGNGYVDGVEENINKAREVAAWLWSNGHAVICPHANTSYFEKISTATHSDYLRGDLIMIERCDGIVMLPGWEDSKGACIEKQHAEKTGVPIYLWPKDMDLLKRTKEQILMELGYDI